MTIRRPITPAVTNGLQESPCRSTRNPHEPPAPSSNESRCGIVSVYNEVERAVADNQQPRAPLGLSSPPPCRRPRHQPPLHERFESIAASTSPLVINCVEARPAQESSRPHGADHPPERRQRRQQRHLPSTSASRYDVRCRQPPPPPQRGPPSQPLVTPRARPERYRHPG